MRARSASISASGVTGIVNGRIAVAPAELSVGTDMWVSSVWLARWSMQSWPGWTEPGPAAVGRRMRHQLIRIPLPQAVRPHDRAPGECVPPVTALAVTLVVTLVSYRAP